MTSLNGGSAHENATMSRLRKQYWVVRMGQLVKSELYKCTTCRRVAAGAHRVSEAQLPSFRVEQSMHPFKSVGIDYFGPLIIKDSTGKAKKVWVALFTCAVVGAIYLDAVEDLTASSFLLAFKRFVACHGLPSRIISDNALTFCKADRALRALWQSLSAEEVQEYLGKGGVQWDFNTPRASWHGGLFERKVKTSKSCLRKTMKMAKLGFPEFLATIKEIAAVINSRPITHLPAGPEDPPALTPAHFISPNIPIVFAAGQAISLGD